jgi:hypothetical protein
MGHGDEPDVHFLCQTLAHQCDNHQQDLEAAIEHYGETSPEQEPARLHAEAIGETRTGSLGLLRDLQELYLLASLVDITWALVKQAGQGLRDAELLAVVAHCEKETAVQLAWLKTRMKQAAPQVLIATDD